MSESIAGHLIRDSFADEGGSGYVLFALTRGTRAIIAVKTLRAFKRDDEVERKRFETEANVLKSLQHPHIVKLLESGFDENYGWYYTMPFLSGGHWERARAEGASVFKFMNWWMDVAGAVKYAHARSLFHRDLKPKNIVLHEEASTLVDWGLGKTTPTVPGGTLSQGTFGWSPEEFWTENRSGAFTDTFGMIGLLGWILTGERPDRLNAEITERLGRVGLQFPELEAVIRKGLAPWTERYQTMDDMWTAVLPVVNRLKRTILDRDGTGAERREAFWVTGILNNTNSLHPDDRNFTCRHGTRMVHAPSLSFVQLIAPERKLMEDYFELGVELGTADGTDVEAAGIWRLEISGPTHTFHYGAYNSSTRAPISVDEMNMTADQRRKAVALHGKPGRVGHDKTG